MTTGPWIKLICVMALAGAVVAGCGRKGALERPGASPAPAAAATSTGEDDAPATPPAPERRFILDSLLD
ncbi:LPS translocon maturation chaperone LptM [Hoeflea olei]|uniref:Lipoprotein n=1 Tax=Hoeflea olei TaxID=1480615 RepID=A0A1C1YXN9_9HYPH|nr:lipoprotein [Hoeflea olei]OCW58281.1 hypothetical protein AWJ14_21560 [Hoeflea olei]